MTDDLLEHLLHAGESATLDYKRDQYPYVDASDEVKSELLKDILALANAWRQTDGHILIGVQEVVGKRSIVLGVGNHIAESDLQQFVNCKTKRPITFSYRAYDFEGKQIGIITIPVQQRPHFILKKFGKVEKDTVYYRLGSATAIADPDEIARMGAPVEFMKILDEQREEAKREQVRVDIGIDAAEGLYVTVFNEGDVPVHIKEVALCRSHPPDTEAKVPLVVNRKALSKKDDPAVGSDHRSYDLAVRKEVQFVLPNWKAAFLRNFMGSDAQAVRLAVFSYGGEVYRVPGEQVFHVMADVIKLLELHEKSAKPRHLTIIFFNELAGGLKQEVGSIKAIMEQPDVVGPVRVRLGQVMGVSITPEEADQLARELVNDKVMGQIGNYQWRID